MKVCSFLPAVTKMIYDMNLQDHLYGVTFECPARGAERKPKLVRCVPWRTSSFQVRRSIEYFLQAKHRGKVCIMWMKDCCRTFNPI